MYASHGSEVPLVKASPKNLVAGVVASLAAIAFWRDPSGSAHATGHFLGNAGHVATQTVDKASSFFKHLAK